MGNLLKQVEEKARDDQLAFIILPYFALPEAAGWRVCGQSDSAGNPE